MRRRIAFEIALCALLVVLFHHQLLRLGWIQSGGDSANLFWPGKHLLRETLLNHGALALWNPYIYMGTPLAASMQHGVFYPPDLILLLVMPAHWAMNISVLLHLVFAGVGTWFLLRRVLCIDALASVGFGAAFPCVAWFWGHMEHINQVAVTAYMPWILALVWLLARGDLRRRTFVLVWSVLSSLQFLAGHPQAAVYTHLASLAIAGGAIILQQERAAAFLRVIIGFTSAGLITGLLVCIQLLPTLELQEHSRRQFRDPTYAISFSMPPDVLRLYVNPHAFGSFVDGYWVQGTNPPEPDRRAYNEYGVFVGVPTLLLAMAAWMARGRRRETALLWGMALAALVLAMGANMSWRAITGGDFSEQPAPGHSLYEIFIRLIPPLQGFRVPARWVIVTSFSLVCLAAIATQGLAARLEPHQSRRMFTFLAVTVALLSLYIPSRKEKFRHPVDVRAVAEIVASTPKDETLRRHIRLTLNDDGNLIAERHFADTFIDGNPIERRFIGLQPNMNMMMGEANVDGYEEGLVPTARFKDFLYHFNRNFRRFRPDPVLLSLLGVHAIRAELPVDESTYPAVERLGPWTLYRHDDGSAAAFWPDRFRGVDYTLLDGPFWRGGEPLPEISRTAASYGDAATAGDRSALIPVRVPSPNRIVIDPTPIADPAADHAILALGWFPGWVFQPSGAPVEFLNAVHARLPLSESAVPEGALFESPHAAWRLEYRPFAYRLGLFLTGLGVAAVAFVAGWRRKPT